MIRLAASHLELLAATSRLESMGGQFRKGSKSLDFGDVLLWLSVLAVIGLMIWVLVRFKDRQDGPDRTNRPHRLFGELCRVHALKFSDRWLLWRVARWQRVTQPAKLFLEPERFDAANLSPRLCKHQPRLALLRKKLFAAED